MAVFMSNPRPERSVPAANVGERGALTGAARPASPPGGRIGDFMREAHELSDAQIEEILLYQRQHAVRFGEAAESLNLVTRDDVLQAIAKQFEVPYAPTDVTHIRPSVVAAVMPYGDGAEHFRELRSQLLVGLWSKPEPRRALAIVGTDRKDGRSFFAANLAVSLSQLGARTLLIDADSRAPSLHNLFGASNSTGLTNLLAGRQQGAIAPVPGLGSLSLLPSGPVVPNALELLERPAFSLLMHEWLARFDHVIVDTPATCSAADARVIAAKCGAAMVVARPGRTDMKSLTKLVAQLQKSRCTLSGIAFNEQ